jgi:hypothetical protein
MPRTAWLMMLVGLAATRAAPGQSNIDPDHKYAWGENIGWTNWRDADAGEEGVVAGATFLSGFVWAENVGWINVGDGTPSDGTHYANSNGLDFGVNIGTNGVLVGLAWGENIGWVNFDTSSLGDDRARFDACEHTFLGYAWGENVGWINLDDATHFVAVGPCGFGDYDCDGDVDLGDYVPFADWLEGPGAPVDCAAFDADEDGDVDLEDFAVFAEAFTGAT